MIQKNRQESLCHAKLIQCCRMCCYDLFDNIYIKFDYLNIIR